MELSGVMRTSTVLIAAGDRELEFYRSVEEVPEPLRRMLVNSTNGHNSGTVYIADRGGRALMSDALSRLPDVWPGPVSFKSFGVSEPQPKVGYKSPISLASLWFALVIALFSGTIFWLLRSRSW